MDQQSQSPGAGNGRRTSVIHPNGRLYTVSQAAAFLRLSQTWIYERTRKDAIPHRKLGKYIRFTDSDLSEIIQRCSRGHRKEADEGSNEELFNA
jgi:excisionase family DNA binding protein